MANLRRGDLKTALASKTHTKAQVNILAVAEKSLVKATDRGEYLPPVDCGRGTGRECIRQRRQWTHGPAMLTAPGDTCKQIGITDTIKQRRISIANLRRPEHRHVGMLFRGIAKGR